MGNRVIGKMLDMAKLNGEVEPIRTGRSLGERKPAGKMYPVDPEAVARLKKIVTEREKLRGAESRPEKNDILGNMLRTQYERQAELNARRRKPEIPADLAREWHISYYQAGFSIMEVAERAGIGRNRLTKRWRELGLPVSRRVEERAWPQDEEGDETQV